MKVVCYNLDDRMKYCKYREGIVFVISSLNPDIVILQEITRWEDVKYLAKRLDMYCSRGAWCSGGTTVLSSIPILETYKRKIPKSSWGSALVGIRVSKNHCPLGCKANSENHCPLGCKANSENVWIMSAHLDDSRYGRNEDIRLREAEFIINHLPQNSKDDKYIIGGDFNSISHLDEYNIMRKLPSHLFEEEGWNDVQSKKKWTRGTWIPSNTEQRIDRLYTVGKIKSIDGGILDRYDYNITRWPTGRDHRLIWHKFQ